MILVDETKAIVIGRMDVVTTEVAFLMDKLCSEAIEKSGTKFSYEEIQETINREVKKLRRERDRGEVRNHPGEDPEVFEVEEKSSSHPRGQSPAELALVEAMAKIEEMKAEKAEKAEKDKKKKKKKTKAKKNKGVE